jgi:hypothetical protein
MNQMHLAWICIVQLGTGLVLLSLVALLSFFLPRKSFIAVHIVPFIQLIGLFALVPVHTIPNSHENAQHITESSVHFFAALTVNITFFLSRPY